MAFSAAEAVRAFEATTGARLQARPNESPSYKRIRRRFGLSRVEIFEIAPEGADRFGGSVTVRVEHDDEVDRGPVDRGLEIAEIERGPRAGTSVVGGSASRANVEVMFYREATEIDLAAQEAWAALTAFLHRL
jgi:hypothetical protein